MSLANRLPKVAVMYVEDDAVPATVDPRFAGYVSGLGDTESWRERADLVRREGTEVMVAGSAEDPAALADLLTSFFGSAKGGVDPATGRKT
jgi:hypothetical protein